MHDHMMDFGGFLRSHSGIQRDLTRDPAVVKDNGYVQNHPELVSYLNAHPDVRAELMANPQTFVHGAAQFGSGNATGSGAGTGTSGSVTGTTGSGTTGSTTGTSPTTTHEPAKPNQ